MKKVMLSALLAGMIMFGSAYAQTTTASVAGTEMKKDKVEKADHGKHLAKGHSKDNKGKGKKKGHSKMKSKPAEQK